MPKMFPQINYSSSLFVHPALDKLSRNKNADINLCREITGKLGSFDAMVTYASFACCPGSDGVDTGGIILKGKKLAEHLKECSEAVIFIATLGKAFDEHLNRYSLTDRPAAYQCQLLGLYLIEEVCDIFENEITGGKPHASRFSPGYGDFDMSEQQKIFSLLRPESTIGVCLGSSMLMSPSKTVSAIIGIKGK